MDYTLIAVVLPTIISIVGGCLAMAWKLGGLDNRVRDLSEDVKDLQREVRNGH